MGDSIVYNRNGLKANESVFPSQNARQVALSKFIKLPAYVTVASKII